MNLPSRIRSRLAPLAAAWCVFLAAASSPGQTLSDVRAELRQNLSASKFAAGLVGLTLLADELELAGATYDIDGSAADTRLTTLGLPFQKLLTTPGSPPDIYLEGAIGTALAKQSTGDIYQGAIPGLETAVDSDTRTYAGQIGGGPQFALSPDFTLTPLVNVGLAYTENDADYAGPGTATTAAVLDGLAFNWDAWSASAGLGLRADYRRPLTDQHDFEAVARYDLRWSETFDATDDAQEFSSRAQVVTLRADFTGPTGFAWQGNTLDWRVFVASRHFLEADLFGSNDYLQLGGALSFGGNLPKEMHLPDPARFVLSGSLLFGDNLTGFGFGLSMAF